MSLPWLVWQTTFTCYGSSDCCNHSRCCGWSSVEGFKCTVPGGLSLRLLTEQQCILNCPHSDFQLRWECGFWIVAKVQFSPYTLFFSLFHGGVNSIWRGTGMLNREHWLEKLFPAETSIFYLLPGNSLACFSLQIAKGCCGMTFYRRLDVPVYVEDYLVQPCPCSRCWLCSLLPLGAEQAKQALVYHPAAYS